jgi:hypothetical protein
MRGKIVQFEDFRALGRGAPFLYAKRNPKTMRLAWGDGTLCDCAEFQAAIRDASLDAELMAAWMRYQHKQPRGAEMSDGVPGYALRVSHALGKELLAIVQKHFTAALEKLRVAGDPGIEPPSPLH